MNNLVKVYRTTWEVASYYRGPPGVSSHGSMQLGWKLDHLAPLLQPTICSEHLSTIEGVFGCSWRCRWHWCCNPIKEVQSDFLMKSKVSIMNTVLRTSTETDPSAIEVRSEVLSCLFQQYFAIVTCLNH